MTPELLRLVMPCSILNAVRYANYFDETFTMCQINTAIRQAAFLAQVAHESGCLAYTKELASGSQYEGRMDLGNVKQGDGVRYKGHGFIQVTGRANHAAIGVQIEKLGWTDVPDFQDDPEELCEPRWCVASAGAFWYWHGLNELADINDDNSFLKISKRINGVNRLTGEPNGLADRRMLWARARAALGVLQ